MPRGGGIIGELVLIKNLFMEDFDSGLHKQSGDGFVKKEAEDNKEKAEYMAHAENSIRATMEETIAVAMSKLEEKMRGDLNKKAEVKGEEEGAQYEAGKSIRDFFERNRNFRVFRLAEPYCCECDTFEYAQKMADELKDRRSIGIGDNEEFGIVGCGGEDIGGSYLVNKEGEVFLRLGRKDVINSNVVIKERKVEKDEKGERKKGLYWAIDEVEVELEPEQ